MTRVQIPLGSPVVTSPSPRGRVPTRTIAGIGVSIPPATMLSWSRRVTSSTRRCKLAAFVRSGQWHPPCIHEAACECKAGAELAVYCVSLRAAEAMGDVTAAPTLRCAVIRSKLQPAKAMIRAVRANTAAAVSERSAVLRRKRHARRPASRADITAWKTANQAAMRSRRCGARLRSPPTLEPIPSGRARTEEHVSPSA